MSNRLKIRPGYIKKYPIGFNTISAETASCKDMFKARYGDRSTLRYNVNRKRFNQTFGIEIECLWPLHRAKKFVPLSIESDNLIPGADGTVFGLQRDLSFELKTVICDCEEDLDWICNFIARSGVVFNNTCGMHVHIGTFGLLGPNSERTALHTQVTKNMLLIGMFFEPVLVLRHLYDHRITREFCRPICSYARGQEQSILSGNAGCLHRKYSSIYIHPELGTIEFRTLQGTSNTDLIRKMVKIYMGLATIMSEFSSEMIAKDIKRILEQCGVNSVYKAMETRRALYCELIYSLYYKYLALSAEKHHIQQS